MSRPRNREVRLGVAWYRREQWPRLHEISEDRDKLEDSYDEWLAEATKALEGLKSQGLAVEKVDVDCEALLAWCRTQSRTVNAEARAAYTTEKVNELHQPPGQKRK